MAAPRSDPARFPHIVRIAERKMISIPSGQAIAGFRWNITIPVDFSANPGKGTPVMNALLSTDHPARCGSMHRKALMVPATRPHAILRFIFMT
jgi:hypothetical protein